MSGDAERWVWGDTLPDDPTVWRLFSPKELAAHDAAVRAETLREAANAADGFASGVREDTGDWLRTRADLARAAQPTEGES